MKKNKGFTLIELLAVIVILAVIALIATPIIMNVINDSKEGAAKDAMYGYVKAVELAASKTITATTDAPSGTYTVNEGNLVRKSETLTISFKGTKPQPGGSISLKNGTVMTARLKFDNIAVSYDGKQAELGEHYYIGEEVYFDPTGTVTDCNAGIEWTPSNMGTTCYKWNIIKDSGSSIEMLVDHNTTEYIAWNSSNDNAGGPLEAYQKLKNDTASWSIVETLTTSDNATRENGSGGTYTINYNGMKARFLSYSEIELIAKTNKWLYQNTKNNGDAQNGGYWTDTASIKEINRAWSVYYEGFLYEDVVAIATNRGIRPVVRVLKSNI